MSFDLFDIFFTCKSAVPGPLAHPPRKAAVPGTLCKGVIFLLVIVGLLDRF